MNDRKVTRRPIKRPDVVMMDLDNTLYEYAPAHLAGMVEIAEVARHRLNLEGGAFTSAFNQARNATKDRLGETASSHSRLLYVQEALDTIGAGSQVSLMLQLEQAYWRGFMSEMRLRVGLVEFLEDLRMEQIPAVLVTDLTAAVQFRKIIVLGLEGFFRHIVTSEGAGVEKPHPRIFEIALQKLGFTVSNPWMIGDDLVKDLRGASTAADAVTILVCSRTTVSLNSDFPVDLVAHDFLSIRLALKNCIK